MQQYKFIVNGMKFQININKIMNNILNRNEYNS